MTAIFREIGKKPNPDLHFLRHQQYAMVKGVADPIEKPTSTSTTNNQYYPGYSLLNKVRRYINERHITYEKKDEDDGTAKKEFSKHTKRFLLLSAAIPAFLISVVEAIIKCALAIFPCSLFAIAKIPASKNLFKSAKHSLCETADLFKRNWKSYATSVDELKTD